MPGSGISEPEKKAPKGPPNPVAETKLPSKKPANSGQFFAHFQEISGNARVRGGPTRTNLGTGKSGLEFAESVPKSRQVGYAGIPASTEDYTMAVSDDLDTDGGPPRRVDVELFIVHPTVSPAEITAALGLEAHFAHRVGDVRKTPKGTLLEGQYQDTRWRYCIRYELNDQWFADKIGALVNSLAPHKAFLHR